jgi:hypothetical protein
VAECHVIAAVGQRRIVIIAGTARDRRRDLMVTNTMASPR